jgi:hypothetical protein
MLAARPNLRPATRRNYTEAIHHYLAAWLDMPLREIDRDMVESRHREIAAEIGQRGHSAGTGAANFALRTLRIVWNFVEERHGDLGPNPVRLRGQWFEEPRRTGHVLTMSSTRSGTPCKAWTVSRGII